MIGRLHGILLEKHAPHLLLEVAGVGYELQAPMPTFFGLPELGSTVVLHTHLAISESAHQLFGFAERRDRDLFRLLIKVSGVGPKLAIAMLSMDSDSLVRCILENDLASLVKIPGVGKKTAERLLIELRDRIKAWEYGGKTEVTSSESLPVFTASSQPVDMIAEAESALVALGYKPLEASKAVARIDKQDMSSSENIIRLALRSMLPGATRG